jgi:short-subunit dehydrogenase
MHDAMLPRTVLVTGASAGIGKAIAEVFASEGFDLVLTARRFDRLEALAGELRQRFGRRVTTIADDLADPAAPGRIADAVAMAGLTIDALVNNAGYGVPGKFTDTTWEQQRDMVQVMVMAPAELTHRLLPGMIARRYGRIINVASVAGLVPQSAGHPLYGASTTSTRRRSARASPTASSTTSTACASRSAGSRRGCGWTPARWPARPSTR